MNNSLMVGIFAALFLPVSFAKAASHYSNESIEILAVASHCADEFHSLSKLATVGGATHEAMEDLDIYTIQFVLPARPPFMQIRPVKNLVISRTFELSTIHAPDAPGGAFVYKCQIVEPAPMLEN